MSGSANREAPPWFTGDFSDLPDKRLMVDDPQVAAMRPRFKISGYRRVPEGGTIQKDLRWLIRVDCTNSSVNPGNIVWNQEDKRGYFTHALKVRISLPPKDGYVSAWSFPSSTREGGSVSSSVSTSVNAGFFGTTPTASYSGTISSGASQSFPDFEIYNNDGAVGSEIAEHVYKLRLITGSRYERPLDMLDDSIYQGRVRELCPAALSKFDIISSALFQKSDAVKGPSLTRLSIDFSYTLMFIEKTWVSEFWLPQLAKHRFVLPVLSSDADAQTTCKAVALGKILVDSIPVTVTGSWQFDIDMDKGTVVLHG